MPDGSLADRRPLTVGEKAWLATGCVPVVFFAAVTLAIWWLPARISHARPGFFAFSALVITIVGYQASRRLRDLVLGYALIAEDRLERDWRSRRSQVAWGRFERLGTLHFRPHVLHSWSAGHINRIHYSPASRIVWSIEPREPLDVPPGRSDA